MPLPLLLPFYLSLTFLFLLYQTKPLLQRLVLLQGKGMPKPLQRIARVNPVPPESHLIQPETDSLTFSGFLVMTVPHTDPLRQQSLFQVLYPVAPRQMAL